MSIHCSDIHQKRIIIREKCKHLRCQYTSDNTSSFQEVFFVKTAHDVLGRFPFHSALNVHHIHVLLMHFTYTLTPHPYAKSHRIIMHHCYSIVTSHHMRRWTLHSSYDNTMSLCPLWERVEMSTITEMSGPKHTFTHNTRITALTI